MAQIAKVKFLWRIVDLVVAGIFIVAGLTKIFDLDHVIADIRHLGLGDLLIDLQSIRLADPAGFANDIDNYKLLPWMIGLALAFYLPWLEILCGVALIVRRLYLGGLSILAALISVSVIATLAAKVRGLDITCGCFGHASKNWNFSTHLGLDLVLLGLIIFLLCACGRNFTASSRNAESRKFT
jgi:putative oxidoreductase